MRRVVALVAGALVAGVAVPAFADHVPVNETPDYNVVDGTPICGVEGQQYAPVPDLGPDLGDAVPTVGTYNILHSQGENDDADVTDRQDQVVDALIDGDADAWGLQEVTNDAEHGNQAEELATALADHYQEPWQWCWSMSNPRFPGEPDVLPGGGGPLSELTAQFSKLPEGDLSGFKEGLAVVTRFDIRDAKFRRLPPRAHEALSCPIEPDPLAPIDCQFPAVFDSRQVLHTEIETGERVFDLFNTHIAHSSSSLTHAGPTKKRQIERVVETVDEWARADGPHFLVGDFNTDAAAADDPADPHDDASRYAVLMDAGFVDTYADAGARECGTHPVQSWRGCTSGQDEITAARTLTVTTRIDFVFARSHTCTVSSEGTRIIGTNAEKIDPPADTRWRWPSDHLGVASETTCV